MPVSAFIYMLILMKIIFTEQHNVSTHL